ARSAHRRKMALLRECGRHRPRQETQSSRFVRRGSQLKSRTRWKEHCMVRRNQFLIVLASFACVALWGAAQQTAEEIDANRRRLETLRKTQPEEVVRLRANLKSFQQLPPERQQAIRKLDKDLHDFSPKKQERYFAML